MNNVVCDCEGWKSSANQIFGSQTLAWTHGISYTGKIWKFCPWCGKTLVEEKKEENNVSVHG